MVREFALAPILALLGAGCLLPPWPLGEPPPRASEDDDDTGGDDDDQEEDCSVLVDESFETGVPPLHWTEYRVSGMSEVPWTSTSGMDGYDEPIDGQNCAGLQFEPVDAQDRALQMPSVDPSGCGLLALSFLHQQSGGWEDVLMVESSLDQGDWVEEAAFVTGAESAGWQSRAVVLDMEDHDLQDLRIRFRYVAPANANSQTLDSVLLVASDGG